MDHSALSPLLPLYLSECLFGILYAILIHWISVQGYLKGSTAYSVVIGDGVTLLLEWLFIPKEWDPLVTFTCFACSGFWMVVSYLFRHQQMVLKHQHKRRPWPNMAARVRDEVLMDLTLMSQEIESAANADQVTTGFLVGLVNRIHTLKRLLTSV